MQALHFIRNNTYRRIKVDQVLLYFGVSRSNLDGRFRCEQGHSIHQEIYRTKLSKAVSLLLKTNLPIAEVSKICGYTSVQYFYAVFKKAFSKIPKEYREARASTAQEEGRHSKKYDRQP